MIDRLLRKQATAHRFSIAIYVSDVTTFFSTVMIEEGDIMNDIDAKSIFEGFQTRRGILRRAGKLGLAAGLPLTLAACLEMPDNAYETIEGRRHIRLVDGRNCWGNQCFYLDAGSGEISVAGRQAVPVPGGIDLSDGRVTETEFDALVSAARMAPRDPMNDGSQGGNGGGASGGSGGGGTGGSPGGNVGV